MTKPKTYTTAAGRVLTDDDLDAIATEVEHAEYDVEDLKTRRRGRPRLGSAPAEVVPVRLDPELKSAVDREPKPNNSRRVRSSAKRSAATSTSRSNPSPRAVGSASDSPLRHVRLPHRGRDSTVTVPSGW